MEELSKDITNMRVISRNDVTAITSVLMGDQLHLIGEQRDFRRNSFLKRYIPEDGRVSIAWIRLRDGEVLDNHRHPTNSMILVCSGTATVTGDVEQKLKEGDIICVPDGCKHGFITKPGECFYGLSIQFEGKGLYEDITRPRIKFIDTEKASLDNTTTKAASSVNANLTLPVGTSPNSYEALNAWNELLIQRHGQNSLFNLFKTGVLAKDEKRRKRFLESLYVWSGYFQKMVFARQAFCVNEELLPVYAEHLREEIGHDKLLQDNNKLKGGAYDPILEAASLWFVNKMLSSDEAEKLVIVHMVVESSGHLFGEATKELFPKQKQNSSSYFEVHAAADDDHSAIGRPYLKNQDPSIFPKLIRTCRQAWDQMNLVHERIAIMTMDDSDLFYQS